MKKIVSFFIFIFIILLIGRNLTFLPRIYLYSTPDKETEKLKTEIKNIISAQKGNYSVYFSNLNSGRSFGINEKQTHTAASVNKVPIMAVLYYLANKKELSLDEKITIQEKDIQDYGTGSLRYEEPGGTYSLKTLAKLALQKSDNTAAYIIATKIGMDKIQKIIESWGLSQTNMALNKTSIYDMHILFKKIYNKKLFNNSLTKEFLSFLQETDIENRIPLFLPKSTHVYHKTGDSLGSMHDLGIIEYNGVSIFIGVMTSDIEDKEQETKQTIAKIAKKVLDFTFK